MASLRDQLRARRATYLERIAVFDSLQCKEPYDIRPVATRGFFEGGDDISPKCEAKGVKAERRRLPSYISLDEVEAARGRQGDGKTSPSGPGDWDAMLTARDVDGDRGGSGETRLYRITAQLVRATEYFKAGVTIPPEEVLDLATASVPSPGETEQSVQKAWHLLLIAGVNDHLLPKCYVSLIEIAGTPTVGGIEVLKALPAVVDVWVHRYHWKDRVVDAQQCAASPDLPDRTWDQGCACQRQPPPPPGAAGAPPEKPDLQAAIRAAADAAAAAALPIAQLIVDEFRFIETPDESIALILLWLADRWNSIPPQYQPVIISSDFTPRRAPLGMAAPADPPITAEEAALAEYFDQWATDVQVLQRIRAIPQFFIALSQKNVGDVCAAIVKGLWPNDDDSPFNGDGLKYSGLERDDFIAAVDRAVAGNREDGPLRLATLLNSPEGYICVLDKVGPAGEDGEGANGLARPDLSPLSVYYWRNVISTATAGNILAMADTADFQIAEHVRFLGLFRPGGKYRTGKPEDDKYETYIAQLIPDWVIRFMTAALLRVKYWLDDPFHERPSGEEMTYWSENHQILFASAEYILPDFFPGQTFSYVNQSGGWHRDRARTRVRAWLEHRLQFGYSEMNSGVYYNQHLPALFNLVDFAPEDDIRTKALMALDLLMFDIVRRVAQGSYVAASSRQYWAPKRDGWSVSLTDTIELLCGSIGECMDTCQWSAVCFATSRYIDEIPEALLAICFDTVAPRIDRSRTSINLDESDDYGIDPDSSTGIVFWWGNGAYFTDRTYRSSQSWSYRWGLRNRGGIPLKATGPFKLFSFIDWAIVRIVSAILNYYASVVGLAISAVRQQVLGVVLNYFSGLFANLIPASISTVGGTGFPLTLLNGAILAPQVLRRLVDVALAVLDGIIGLIAGLGKAVGLLDENDDRVRVAYPALEQEFRELAIKFNAGSVLERQHLYGWRSRDAMLTSLVDNHKGNTSFQCEPCVATLGLNISVFTGKRNESPSFLTKVAQAAKGYLTGIARYAYDPEVFFTSQLGFFGGESSPEIGGLVTPFAAGAAFGDDGPGYWFGNISLPFVWQYENVAISMYSPDSVQKDLSPKQTHAHWPFDHFDEIQTDERNGGRWLFGRRDRRFPPRTPCEPGPGRPTADTPWPVGSRRDEGGSGSGYIALFSAAGMKTSTDAPYGHREVIADGHDNIWITIVGDRAAYHSFQEFHDDVLAATLEVDLDDLTCAITTPAPGSAKSGVKGKNFEVSWDDGAKIGGEKLETAGWPRFEWKRSEVSSNPDPVSSRDVRVDDVVITSKADPGKGKVDWDEKAWTITVNVRAWVEQEVDGKSKWIETAGVLSLAHDFSNSEQPQRRVSPEGIQVIHPIANRVQTETQTLTLAKQAPRKTTTSILGQSFRVARKELRH